MMLAILIGSWGAQAASLRWVGCAAIVVGLDDTTVGRKWSEMMESWISNTMVSPCHPKNHGRNQCQWTEHPEPNGFSSESATEQDAGNSVGVLDLPQLFPKVDLLLSRQIQMIRQLNPLLKITQIGPPIKKPSMGAGRPTFLKLLVGNPSCSPAIWEDRTTTISGRTRFSAWIQQSTVSLSGCWVISTEKGCPKFPCQIILSNIQLSNIHHFWTSWENPGIASSSWSSHNTDPRRRASGTVSLPVTAQIRWVGSTTTSKMQCAWTSIVYSCCISLIYFPWSTRKKNAFLSTGSWIFRTNNDSLNSSCVRPCFPILKHLARPRKDIWSCGNWFSSISVSFGLCHEDPHVSSRLKLPTMATDGTPGLHGSRKSRDRLAAPPVPEALRRLVQLV